MTSTTPGTEIVDKVKEKDLVMMTLGDFDAKLSGDHRGYEQAMGKHGLGVGGRRTTMANAL